MLLEAAGEAHIAGAPPADPAGIEITGIHYRSDRVQPGGLFVALSGKRFDGHDFVQDAVGRGAAAVVAGRLVPAGVPVIVVENPRMALARMAAAFHGHPARQMILAGVTGTNGKTTTAFLLEHILQCRGLCTGMIGTINYHYAGKTFQSRLTTPEAADIQQMLAEMRAAGVSHAVLEVSSHGVALERIAGCEFRLGIFTNLSQDHLDFHGDMQEYWSAKKLFFTRYLGGAGAAAVINIDDEKGRELAGNLAGIREIRVGLGNGATVYASGIRFDQGGIYGRLHLESGSFTFHSSLAGRFNLENILCAAAGAEVLGVPIDVIREGIESFAAVPGRLERVPNTLDRHVFVDFSHTPAALQNVLVTLGEIVSGRLICIFGCGGDRDRGKRPEMGRIAARYADLVIVTSDNPRTEPPGRIIDDIVSGMDPCRKVSADALDGDFSSGTFAVEPDRRRAIRIGIRASKPGDAVLIAGKGHETYQIIGHRTVAFDDRLEAERVLAWEMDDVADTMDH